MGDDLREYCINFRLAVMDAGPDTFGAQALADIFLMGLPKDLLNRMGRDRNGDNWATWEEAEQAAIAAERFTTLAAAYPKSRAHAAPMQVLRTPDDEGAQHMSIDRNQSSGSGSGAGNSGASSGGKGGTLAAGRFYGNKGRPAGNPRHKGQRCYNCDEYGHLSYDCPKPPKNQNGKRSRCEEDRPPHHRKDHGDRDDRGNHHREGGKQHNKGGASKQYNKGSSVSWGPNKYHSSGSRGNHRYSYQAASKAGVICVPYQAPAQQ
jgi:hypothetical protein